MKAPKALAVTFCGDCDLVTFADHVNREDEIPHRYCSHCGKVLSVLAYRLERTLQSREDRVRQTAIKQASDELVGGGG